MDIQVSVICTTYNHKPYIRQCLESLVTQKTNFRYEVIVHDDASTDGTAEIVREYAEAYPELIVPILQKENQYSKGRLRCWIYPPVHGKYIASCEGDDFWTDPNKLQKQYDFMEANPEYSLCVHRAIYHPVDCSRKDHIFPDINCDRDFSFEEIIQRFGHGLIFALNSAFRKAEISTNCPECFRAKGFGDAQLYMYSAIVGKVRCLSDVMSQYNHGVSGSWTERIWKDPQNKLLHTQEKIRMLKAVDEYYDGKYSEILTEKIHYFECEVFAAKHDKKMLKQEPYKAIYRKRRVELIEMGMIYRFPKLYTLYRKVVSR